MTVCHDRVPQILESASQVSYKRFRATERGETTVSDENIHPWRAVSVGMESCCQQTRKGQFESRISFACMMEGWSMRR